MLVQGHDLGLRHEVWSRVNSSTWDKKTRTVSTCWINLRGLSLNMAAPGVLSPKMNLDTRLFMAWRKLRCPNRNRMIWNLSSMWKIVKPEQRFERFLALRFVIWIKTLWTSNRDSRHLRAQTRMRWARYHLRTIHRMPIVGNFLCFWRVCVRVAQLLGRLSCRMPAPNAELPRAWDPLIAGDRKSKPASHSRSLWVREQEELGCLSDRHLSGNDKRPESRGLKKLSEFGNSSLQGYKSSQNTCFIVLWCNQRGVDDPWPISADFVNPRLSGLLSFPPKSLSPRLRVKERQEFCWDL